jgi:tRNA threonylcarbamoyladenosine biosynthesis protein TsaB
MKILAIDTSTHACSAALYVDGETTSFFRVVPRLHGELLLPMIDELLMSSGLPLSELDALAYGCGPGSFTGVRLAASCIQGLAVGARKPIVAVSSLKALAHTLYTQLGYAQLACAFDARMHEVYWGLYQLEAGEWQLQGQEQVIPPSQIKGLPSGQWIGVGDGWGSYTDVLAISTGIQQSFPRCYPNAASVAELAISAFRRGEILEAGEALPTYLRDKVTY